MPYIPIPKGRGFTANPDNSLVFYVVIIPHNNSFVNNHSPGIWEPKNLGAQELENYRVWGGATLPALCPEDDRCAVDMVAHKHWDCNGFRVSSQNVNKEPENTGRQVPPQTESSRIAAAQTDSKTSRFAEMPLRWKRRTWEDRNQRTEESGTENSMLTFSREWAILTLETGALPANGQSPYSVTEVTACLGAGRLLLFIRLQKQTTNTNDNKTKLQYFGCTHWIAPPFF